MFLINFNNVKTAYAFKIAKNVLTRQIESVIFLFGGRKHAGRKGGNYLD